MSWGTLWSRIDLFSSAAQANKGTQILMWDKYKPIQIIETNSGVVLKYTVLDFSTCKLTKLYEPDETFNTDLQLTGAPEVLLLVWLLIPGAAHSPDHLCGNLDCLDLLSANL